MVVHSIFFYFFSSIAIISSIMVIVSKNTVHSVFFLILDFISISCLFIMIGAEFLGMIMLIVYVGAVAVLFLFVVMMLNVAQQKDQILKKSSYTHIPIGLIVSLVIFCELLIVVGGWNYKSDIVLSKSMIFDDNISNAHSLGSVLYTDYIHVFQLSGMILLVAMIGAIVLTFKKRSGIKRQSYIDQISRDKSSGVSLVDVKFKEGVKIDE